MFLKNISVLATAFKLFSFGLESHHSCSGFMSCITCNLPSYYFLFITEPKFCSDCDRACPDAGTLSSDCLYCTCAQDISGQARSDTGMPLVNVSISPQYAENVILAVTTTAGFFEMSGACYGETYVFTKSGFVTTSVAFSSSSQSVTMETRGISACRKHALF